ncbi:MAG TPA: heavy-metal-associated domain-containing protein, partial [Sphingomonadaceae bacterium]|nr:heavy-metal-associated domain-containing protein [Sphingomonadaceae bacterium]
MLLGLLLALGAAAALYAQIEPGDRGVPPIDSSASYEVSGINVDVRGRNADAARTGGWREAQRKGWKMLWGRVNSQPATSAPTLSDSTLDSIVAGIVIEDEEIGPNRYIARLGVLFDRARAGQFLGTQGQISRSPPMLVIPVLYTASAPVTFELRNAWQEAWARFRTGGSPVDYVRVSGTGSDPLLLNAAQAGRRGRGWWRMLLDQYGAADVLVPEVTLHRRWPGGPALATFVA